MERFAKNNRIVYVIMTAILAVTLSVMICFSLVMDNRAGSEPSGAGEHSYEYHVAMIRSGSSDAFWESMYEGAVSAGEECSIYAEDFGEGLNENDSPEELVRMAVAAQVDGIVVESDKTDTMKNEIDQASSQGIPVITLMEDNPDSKRISYVGANKYSLGEMYGQEILKALENGGSNVTVLVPEGEEDTGTNYIYSGISAVASESSEEIHLSTIRTGENREFVSEENIRNLLLDETERPEVLVCLSSIDTISAYQCVRDYNLVGKVKIIGYYTSQEILEGIGNVVIESTIVVDANEAGRKCVMALDEYFDQRYTNEYSPVSVELIDQSNIDDFMSKESGEENGDAQ